MSNGTANAGKVGLRDLAFWLPLTKDHLREGVPFVRSFEGLVKLPIGQIGFILAVVITIIRKNRVVGGDRLSNVSLKAKVDSWQRISRAFFAKEDADIMFRISNVTKRKISYNTCVLIVLI